MEFKKTLKKGDRGEECKAMQQDLQYLGFYTGKIDGIFGPKTEDSVKAFQKKKFTD